MRYTAVTCGPDDFAVRLLPGFLGVWPGADAGGRVARAVYVEAETAVRADAEDGDLHRMFAWQLRNGDGTDGFLCDR